MANDYSTGLAAFKDALTQTRVDALTFKPKLTGSQWADRHAVIPSGTSAETGKIKLYGYQRGYLDIVCDSTTKHVTVLKAARVGYTRTALIALAYYLEHEATLCVIAQPTTEDAADFARSEIGPMLRETPALARLLRPVKKGENQDTLTDITLANSAVLRVRGARSDDAFRRYTARVLVADEYDGEGWAPGVKTQGDKLSLFWTRGETFWDRKLIVGSTPLLLETSRTWQRWLKSDQRRYFVPCPCCGEFQYLEWTADTDAPYGLKWYTDEAGKVTDAYYVCKHNGCIIPEGQKHWMDARGEWRATNPDADEGHAGFHMWTAMSLTPNAGWRYIAAEYLDALKNPSDLMQPFYNLRLGRPYQPQFGQELRAEAFADRLEVYAAEVPDGVRYLVAGCDVQSGDGKNPRIEASVYGVGANHEMWLVGHFILKGNPAHEQVWDDLDQLLLRPFRDQAGRQYFVQAACIDSGGHHTQETYRFTDPRAHRRVWSIKGRSESHGKRNKVWPKRASVKGNSQFYVVGGNAARDFVYRSVSVETPGPRYIHYPLNVPDGARQCDPEFFGQLTAERLIIHRAGWTEWEKPKGKAHEVGVCLVYAYCAIEGLKWLSDKWDPDNETAVTTAVESQKKDEETPEKVEEITEKRPFLSTPSQEINRPVEVAAPAPVSHVRPNRPRNNSWFGNRRSMF